MAQSTQQHTASDAAINPNNWKGHPAFGVYAFHVLPAWEQALVQPDMRDEAIHVPYLPSGVKTPGQKMGAMCVIMDSVYYDECRPYATLPDGRWIPHGPPDSQWQACPSTGAQPDPAAAVAITEMLMQRTIDAMRAEQWEEAIRHAGALGHFLQEPFTPGHAMFNKLFQELFPDPDPTRHQRLHFSFDAGSAHVEDPLPPRLMGKTVPEAAYRLQAEVQRGIKSGKKLVPAVIQSVYEGRPGRVREALLAEQGRQATFVTASAWHTCFSIAFDRFEPQQCEMLRTLDLMHLVPFFWHDWLYTDVLPGCLVQNKRKIPIDVWDRDARGERVERRIEQGFGMGGHMGIKWHVPGDLYARLRLRVGLPSRQTDGQNERTDCRLYVETDPGINRVYSEEMEYQAERRATVPLEVGAPLQDVDVDISGAQTLLLTTQCRPYTDERTGKVGFAVPHVAICEPLLHRTEEPCA